MNRRLLSVLILAPLATACSDVANFADRKFTDSFQQSPSDAADILFVVDNSGSMADEQTLLAQGFESFVSQLEATGTDFHLGVVTTDFDYADPKRGSLIGSPAVLTPDTDYVNLFQQRVHVGVGGSGKEQGLQSATYALSTTMSTGPNQGFMRQDANLLVVIVSDEDDCSDDGRLGADVSGTQCYVHDELLTPVGNYVADLQNLKANVGQVKLAGIVGPRDADPDCDAQSVYGGRYQEVADLTAGMTSSICDGDWSGFMDTLGLTAAGIFTSFPLSHGAAPGTLVVTVDGNVVPESDVDGYTYDATAHTITFHGIWLPERGASVNAEYTIEAGT